MQHRALSPQDDQFHFQEMSDRWWETETAWFSFHHPERRLGGWIYVMARPNIGTVAGGAWVWDHTAHLPWEVLYNANYTALRLPKARDLSDIVLPTGVSLRTLDPLNRYAVGFSDGDRISLDLTFEAVSPPVQSISANSAFGSLGHFDQIGRISGVLVLKGETIEIDCLSVRDRSWGPRPEHRPRRAAYVTGVSSPTHGFVAVSDSRLPEDPIVHGFLYRDGVVGRFVEGRRRVERDADHGWITSVSLDGTDELGRRMTATGEPVSHITINRHSHIDSNSLIRWTIDGEEAWGEDQDLWPIHDWADMRRAGR